MRKKILSMMLAICMVLALMPQMVFAETISGATDDGFSYTISDGKVTITSYTGGSINTNVTIPDTIDDKPVRIIGDRAFQGCNALTSISIPNGVTSIGIYAFDECSGLESITIPDSVTSIGQGAFIGCKNLKSISIPNSVTSIGQGAFVECISLESITIPESVTSIGRETFRDCICLKSITIPDNVTSIGDYAFEGCKILASISIPNSVKSIGNRAFFQCIGLKSITIPDSVTSIGEEAFKYCNDLESISISDRVTSIGKDTFYCCKNLTSVNIPNGVTSIGDNAFYTCESLTGISIPDSVTSIGKNAFYNCKSLESICLPGDLNVTNASIPDTATQVRYRLTNDEVIIIGIALAKDRTGVAIPATICGYPVVAISDKSLLEKISSHTCAGGTATCTATALCSICGKEYNNPDNHSGKLAWETTETKHKQYWDCCKSVVIGYEDHTWSNGKCSKCYYVCAHSDVNPKDHECDICGVTISNHTGGKATCTSKAICDYCNEAYGDFNSHNHAGGTRIRYAKRATCTETGYTGDTYCNGCNRKLYSGTLIEKLAHADENKDHVCDVCEAAISEHTGGKATCTSKAVCDYCGSEYGEPDINNHDIENIPEQAPTYSEEGYREHWQCRECKIYFSDEEGNIQINDIDAWKAGDGKIDKLIPPKTDSVTSDKDGSITVSIEKSIATKDGVTEVNVTDSVAEAILSGLESSESKSVVITAVTGSTESRPSVAKPGTSIQISLPESAVKKLAEVEGVKITIVTDNGSIVLDKGTLEAIASKSGDNGKVTLVIETVEQTGSLLKLELTMKTSDGEVSDFGSGSVEVTVAISDELKGKNPVCIYIDAQGIYHMIGGKLNEDGTFTFATSHFSTYAIMPEEEAASVIKVQTAEAQKAAIKEVKPTVTLSTKKLKKGIKVTVKVPSSKKADKTGVIIYRSQKKSSGYAVYKKVKTTGSTYTITNTKTLKGKRLTKGRKYYYKARAYKIIDGKSYYGPMSSVKYAKAK